MTLYLFGGTGDLSRKKLIPAIFYLSTKKLLPPFRVVAIARQLCAREHYWQMLTDSVHPENFEQWQQFLHNVEYIAGDSTTDKLYQALAADAKNNQGDKLFYLATLPQLYATIAHQLHNHHLTQNANGWSRLLVEKPFGVDLESSRLLNRELLTTFPESNIFRIDHFLAKETVQNILAFRFANGVFERIWNRDHIDHIQITSAEPFGVEGREKFYNEVGVVRDVVQNHVLSLLAIALMEEPASFDSKVIQQERLRLLSQIEVEDEKTIQKNVFFGQYQTDSTRSQLQPSVPTAVALRLAIADTRWRGVPIYIRAGKKFPCRVSELSVVFKEPPNNMFAVGDAKQPPNILTFRIQPNEGIILSVNVKRPGFEYGIDSAPMSFCYSSSFTDAQLPEAYSKVLYDAIKGDTTLFLDEKGVDASWAVVQPLLDWQSAQEQLPARYQAGSWGPATFNQLLQRDGRNWIEPDLTICSVR